MSVQVRKHTDAVIAALEAAGLTVGDGVAPAGDPPYVVVYSIPGGDRGGTLAGPYEDADLIYQATGVGTSRRQAEWLADKIDDVFDAGITVEGRSIHAAPHMNPGIQRDDDLPDPLFYAMPRYRLLTSPS